MFALNSNQTYLEVQKKLVQLNLFLFNFLEVLHSLIWLEIAAPQSKALFILFLIPPQPRNNENHKGLLDSYSHGSQLVCLR